MPLYLATNNVTHVNFCASKTYSPFMNYPPFHLTLSFSLPLPSLSPYPLLRFPLSSTFPSFQVCALVYMYVTEILSPIIGTMVCPQTDLLKHIWPVCRTWSRALGRIPSFSQPTTSRCLTKLPIGIPNIDGFINVVRCLITVLSEGLTMCTTVPKVCKRILQIFWLMRF